MQLPSRDGETENPVEADRSIEAAFKRVREYLRRAEPHGLWHKHNIEYGFARNLLGSASIFIGSAVLCCFISAICKDAATWRVTPVMLLNALYALIWTPFAWFALPLMTRHAADRYAERSWLTFLEIASRDKR